VATRDESSDITDAARVRGGDGEAVTKETAMIHETGITASCPDCGDVEPAEALESHVGTPLTLDDLIDLMLSVDRLTDATQPARIAA
jgi:hypothetical protein